MECYDYFKEQIDDGSVVYLFDTGGASFFTVTFDINLYANHLDRFPYLLKNGYGLSIYPEGEKISSPKISNTIKAILADFLDTEDKEAFLLYHCDYKDKKQAARNRLFQTWYLETKQKCDIYYKYSLEVEIDTGDDGKVKHYVGFISKDENKGKGEAIEEFEQFSVDLVKEGVAKN